MQEIEIKFRVEDVEKVKNILLSEGCHFSEELNQKDTIFVPDLNHTENGEGKVFVRIRKVNNKTILTLKEQTARIMESKEIEFEVGSFEKAYDFLELLGLAKWVTVEKKRVETTYKNYNICIDSVNRLGDFVEIEIVTEDTEHTDFYEQEILGLASMLSIDVNNRINNFYDTMIHELDVEEAKN